MTFDTRTLAAAFGCLLLVVTVCVLTGCGPRSAAPIEAPPSSASTTAPTNSAPPASHTPLLEDIAQQAGIDFVHRASVRDEIYFMPNSIGSGCALLDYDNDGRLDVYMIQHGGPGSGLTNRLYRQTDQGFVDASDGSGLDVDGYGMGVACGDVNNDGLVDVLLNEYGRARLLLNRSSGAEPKFVDISDVAGLQNLTWGVSTSFLDYDRDGWLDLVLVNYVSYDPSRWCADSAGRQEFCSPGNFVACVSKLYRNRGADSEGRVTLEDATITSGLGAAPAPGLGVLCADFDGDTWVDIFVANDRTPNHLWINQHDGTFKDEATTRGVAYNCMGQSEADMGTAIGDVNGNGLFDLFVPHLTTETHTLWSQEARGVFHDRTAMSGVTAAKWRSTGFGTFLADMENDGDLDLLICTGRVYRNAGVLPRTRADLDKLWAYYAEADQLLLNNGQGRFTDVSLAEPALSAVATVSRGLACGDIDNDGGMDVLIAHTAGPPSLLRNVAPARGHWLLVRAVDPALRRDVYGAELRLQMGAQTLMRWINPGTSFLSSCDVRAHFGLGQTDRVDTIEVLWPDGVRESFSVGAVDRQITLLRGEGTAVP